MLQLRVSAGEAEDFGFKFGGGFHPVAAT